MRGNCRPKTWKNAQRSELKRGDKKSMRLLAAECTRYCRETTLWRQGCTWKVRWSASQPATNQIDWDCPLQKNRPIVIFRFSRLISGTLVQQEEPIPPATAAQVGLKCTDQSVGPGAKDTRLLHGDGSTMSSGCHRSPREACHNKSIVSPSAGGSEACKARQVDAEDVGLSVTPSPC